MSAELRQVLAELARQKRKLARADAVIAAGEKVLRGAVS